MKRWARWLAVLPLVAALAGCGKTMFVSASDPVLQVCQSASVANNQSLQSAVDAANNTDPVAPGSGQAMTGQQISGLRQAARDYSADAAQISAGHPAFAAALRNEAFQFDSAASGPAGITTNSIAVATDTYANQIQGDCAAYRVGTVAHTRPGPGIWNWGLFWVVTGGYAFMVLIASFLIAVAERSRPRRKRRGPGAIFGLALVWWVSIFLALGRTYGHVIASATLTSDEKKDDRIKALQKRNAQLEADLRKPIQ